MPQDGFGDMPPEKDVSNTFMIQVLFCQNSSIQGRISWMEGEKSVYFRSLLEMMVLMLEALEESGVPQADYEIRSWNKQVPHL